MRRLQTGSIVLLGLALCLSPALRLLAQPAAFLPDAKPLSSISKNQAIIRAQLQLGLAYEQQALDALYDGAAGEALPGLSSQIHEGYALLRFAVFGIKMKQSLLKIANPLLEMTADRIEEAMNHIRVAKTAVDSVAGGADPAQLASAMDSLEKAISLTELAATLI